MVLPLRTAWIADILSQASLRDVERQRCWKRGSGDFGTTLRHDWAIFSSMPLTGEVRRSPEPSARPSAAADSEERQICTTCLFAESVGLCLCFLPSCAMYKDNAVRNVVAEMGRDLVFMITARLSDLSSMPLKGEVRRSPACTVCTAADCEERQICTTCLFAESVGFWKSRRSYLYVCFLMYARTQKSSNSLILFRCSNFCFLLETNIAGHQRLSSPNDTPKAEEKLRRRPFFDIADRHDKLYGRSRLYASAQGRHETSGVLSLFSSLSFDISMKNSVQRWSSDIQGLFRVKIRKMALGSNDLSTLPLRRDQKVIFVKSPISSPVVMP